MIVTDPQTSGASLRAAQPSAGTADELGAMLQRAIPWSQLCPASAALSSSSVAVAAGQAADDLASWLTADLGDLFTAAWLGHRDLRSAAEESRGHPGAVSVVDLARQSVELTQHAQLTVDVAGCEAASLAIDLAVTGTVTALAVAVRDGCATEVRSGPAVLSSTLQVDRREVWTRTTNVASGLARRLTPPRPL